MEQRVKGMTFRKQRGYTPIDRTDQTKLGTEKTESGTDEDLPGTEEEVPYTENTEDIE